MASSSKYGIPRLTDSNYFTWKVRIFDLLVIKDCEAATSDAQHPHTAKALAYNPPSVLPFNPFYDAA